MAEGESTKVDAFAAATGAGQRRQQQPVQQGRRRLMPLRAAAGLVPIRRSSSAGGAASGTSPLVVVPGEPTQPPPSAPPQATPTVGWLLPTPRSDCDDEADNGGDALGPFYARLNAALLETLTLERRRDGLAAEAAALRALLGHWAAGHGVTTGAVDGPNALLVVNRRTSDTRVVPAPRWLTQPPLSSGRGRGGAGLQEVGPGGRLVLLEPSSVVAGGHGCLSAR